MAGEAEGSGTGTTAVGNTQVPNSPTESLGRTPETSPSGPPPSSPLAEPLTPRAALERLKARRELAPTQETEHGQPAPPASPEKPSGGKEAAPAAPTPSVEADEVDGLLSDFGEPEGSTEEAAPSPTDDDPVVFEIDGNKITRSEGQKGYLRGQDFTVKTQSLAEVRKNFETEIQAVSEDRKRYGTLLGEQLQALKANEPQMPDPAMKVTDPVGYGDKVLEYLAHQDQVRQREAQIGQLVQEQRAADQRLFELKKAEETAKMLESVPSLAKAKNDEQRGKLLSRFKQTAMEAGFAEGELSRLVDHRVIRILEWATIGKAVQKGTIKGHKSQAAARAANGSNGSAPLLPSSSLKSTGGGSAPELKTKSTREVQAAQEAFEKRGGSMRDGVALLKTLRHARGAS